MSNNSTSSAPSVVDEQEEIQIRQENSVRETDRTACEIKGARPKEGLTDSKLHSSDVNVETKLTTPDVDTSVLSDYSTRNNKFDSTKELNVTKIAESSERFKEPNLDLADKTTEEYLKQISVINEGQKDLSEVHSKLRSQMNKKWQDIHKQRKDLQYLKDDDNTRKIPIDRRHLHEQRNEAIEGILYEGEQTVWKMQHLLRKPTSGINQAAQDAEMVMKEQKLVEQMEESYQKLQSDVGNRLKGLNEMQEEYQMLVKTLMDLNKNERDAKSEDGDNAQNTPKEHKHSQEQGH